MSFNFVIPNNKEELLESSGNNYCVSRVLSVNELPNKIREARLNLQQNGVLFIFDHFDAFFSLLDVPESSSSMNLPIRGHEILCDSLNKLEQELKEALKGSPDGAEKRDLITATKMLLYLSASLIKAIDGVVFGKTKKGDFDQPHWEMKRKEGLNLVYNITQNRLEELYEPPVIEEELSNLICDLSYQTLALPCVKDHRVAETAFEILGTAIKRFNHAMTFRVKIIEVLGDKDYSVRPCAEGIYSILYTKLEITSIFNSILKEIIEQLVERGNDTKLAKQYCQFLSEVGSVAPRLIIDTLSELSEDLLDVENYSVRNTVLQLMGEALENDLKGEDLETDLKETRDSFLDTLFEHTQDVSAHVRSKVLSIWIMLKEKNAVPLSRHSDVVQRAVERLEDKSSLVRKQAIGLLCSFLVYNPFAAKLSLEQLEKKYAEEEKNLEELSEKRAQILPEVEKVKEEWEALQTDLHTVIINEIGKPLTTQTPHPDENVRLTVANMLKEGRHKEAFELIRLLDACNREEVDSFGFEKKCLYYMVLLKSYFTSALMPKDFEEEIAKSMDTIKFLHECLEFSKFISKAVPQLKQLLMSVTNSDVIEAIRFFKTSFQFGIKGCEVGMQTMFNLVWSKDKEKRDAVATAYKEVLFTTDLKDRSHIVKVVDNLSRFLEKLTVGEYAAFEVLIREWVEQGVIDHQIIQVMFERYAMKLQGTTPNDARLALQLLLPCVTVDPNIAKGNRDFLIQQLEPGARGIADPRIYCLVLEMFMKAAEKSYERPSKYYTRFEHDSEIVSRVIPAFMRFFFSPATFDFDEVAAKTFDFIYKNVFVPDVLAQRMILEVFEKLRRISAIRKGETESSQNRVSLELPTFLLGRFIYVVGFVAMKEMIYLDIDVYSNMKFRDELKLEKKQHSNKKKKPGQEKRRTVISADLSASNALKRASLAAQSSKEELEEDLVGATAEDVIAEQVNFILEMEILYSDECLLSKFHPFIIDVCQKLNQFQDEGLQQSAVLAMLHLMSVSAKFCEDNVPFIMNIFQNTKNVRVKSNIIIGLADLTFRAPNITEPWSGHLYATLHESDRHLRLTAVKMLSHLIAHEMILVKGQVSDLALCLVDPDVEIRVTTEQFFKEIAQKSNILYNVLPDIISRLSDPSLTLEEGKYRIIMEYIIGLIHKDKQVETLVEKLCLRFNVTSSERQWREIAYCLSLLNHTERTVRKLIEKIPCFKDKVQVQEVYDAFMHIISATSKLAKPELKATIQEFKTKLDECLAVTNGPAPTNDSQTDESLMPAPPVPGKPKKGAVSKQKTTKTRPVRRSKNVSSAKSSSDSSDESSDDDFENQPPSAKKAVPNPARATPTRARTTPARTSARRTTSKVIEESEESSGTVQVPVRGVRRRN